MSRLDTTKPVMSELGALVTQRQDPAAVPVERWPELVQLSLSERLAPMLWWVLQQNRFSLPDLSLNERLYQVSQQATFSSLRLQVAQRRFQAALTASAIPAIWLKGIVLASTIYPQPALRLMNDLDVLVPYARRRQALTVAQELGYHLQAYNVFKPDSDLTHHYGLVSSNDVAVYLELHSRLLNVGGKDSFLPLEQLDWFWQPEQLMPYNERFMTLKPEAHLLYLCGHAILQHGEERLHLLTYFDFHRLLTTTELNWQVVIEQAAALRWSLVVKRALSLTHQLFGTPLPEGMLAQLHASAQEASARKPMLQPYGGGTGWDWFRDSHRGMGWRAWFSLTYALMLPSQAYMRQRYQIAAGRAVWPFYLVRWLAQARQVTAWGFKTVKNREQTGPRQHPEL